MFDIIVFDNKNISEITTPRHAWLDSAITSISEGCANMWRDKTDIASFETINGQEDIILIFNFDPNA